jgi:hypothetical protein
MAAVMSTDAPVLSPVELNDTSSALVPVAVRSNTAKVSPPALLYVPWLTHPEPADTVGTVAAAAVLLA